MNSEIQSEKEAMKARRRLPVFAFHHQTALHLFPVRIITNKNVFSTHLKRRLQRPPAKKWTADAVIKNYHQMAMWDRRELGRAASSHRVGFAHGQQRAGWCLTLCGKREIKSSE